MTIVGPTYEIRVRGYLAPHWNRSFGQMAITRESDGATLFSGQIVDEAALHGTLTRIRDLGLTLLSVIRIEPDAGARIRKDTP